MASAQIRLAALPVALLLSLAGCLGTPDAEVDGADLDPPQDPGTQQARPAPVDLRVRGDVMGSLQETWGWNVSDGTLQGFHVVFHVEPWAPLFTGGAYTLRDAHVRLVDPAGHVHGEYRSSLASGQFRETLIDFHMPAGATVEPGDWSLDFGVGEGIAAYELWVQVVYKEPKQEPAAVQASAGPSEG